MQIFDIHHLRNVPFLSYLTEILSYCLNLGLGCRIILLAKAIADDICKIYGDIVTPPWNSRAYNHFKEAPADSILASFISWIMNRRRRLSKTKVHHVNINGNVYVRYMCGCLIYNSLIYNMSWSLFGNREVHKLRSVPE